MVERPDKDRMLHDTLPQAPAQHQSPSAAHIPATEPNSRTLEDQRQDLQHLIDESEGVLRYMGAAHPQRATTADRLAQLREMLRRLEQAIDQAAQAGR